LIAHQARFGGFFVLQRWKRPMIEDLLEKVARREDLDRHEMARAIAGFVDQTCPEPQVAGLLMAIRVKGESVEELVGAAGALRARAIRPPTAALPVLDTAGTGGDGSGSLNLSTAAALIAAGAGVTVAKHGNRSISSKCGSADVLTALGVPIDLTPEETGIAIDTIGIGFLFAPLYHPAMRAVAGIRRSLAVRTLFNLLGPLTNPAGVRKQLVGVFHPSKAMLMAQALQALEAEHVLVVSGEHGLDEIAPDGTTMVVELRAGKLREYQVTARDFGLEPAPLDTIQGGDPETNAAILSAVLGGERHPARTAVLMNAAAALVAADAASSLAEGCALAARIIDSGAALAKLEGLRALRPAAS
jgi:anthranilate phosphoribosyltransferase